MPDPKLIGDIMVARGLLAPEQAQRIASERLRSDLRFASLAVLKGGVSEAAALEALAVQLGVPAVDIAKAIVEPDAFSRVPEEVATRHLVMPLQIDGANLLVAIANPHDWQIIDEIGFATGMMILPHVALHARLVELIPKAYAAAKLRVPFRGPFAPATATGLPLIAPPSGQRPSGLESIADEPDDWSLTGPPLEGVATLPGSPSTGGVVAAAPAAALRPEPRSRKVIVVVEDDTEILQLVVTALERQGHEVIAAARGLDGLRRIKERRPDLIVVDAMLPEVHGFEICRKVKESRRFRNTPVLMISAVYRGWRLADEIRTTYKVDAFLEKPFRVAELRRLAQQLLQGAASQPAIDEDGAEARLHINVAQQALASGDPERAFGALREAEALEPFSAKVQLMLAQALEMRGRVFQAIYHCVRALELKPDMLSAMKSLATLYEGCGFRKRAIELWERSLRIAPTAELREQIKQYLVNLQ